MTVNLRRDLIDIFFDLSKMKHIANFRPKVDLDGNEVLTMYDERVSYRFGSEYYMIYFSKGNESGIIDNRFKSDSKMVQLNIFGEEFDVSIIDNVKNMDDSQIVLSYGRFIDRTMHEDYSNIISRCKELLKLLIETYSSPEKVHQLKLLNVVSAS